MSCTISESCKLVIENKDREIQEKEKRIIELENELENYETKNKVLKIFLTIQAILLAIGFQIWIL